VVIVFGNFFEGTFESTFSVLDFSVEIVTIDWLESFFGGLV